jgi:pimeloyl-ACP methyl ester carboxylesterase
MKYESPQYPAQLAAEINSGKPGGHVTRRHFGLAALSATAGLLLPRNSFSLTPAPAPLPAPAVASNIVLVHGAFADGSSWSRVIPLVEAKGFNVTAVQNPLNSLADDVATTRRLLAQQTGPTILVGHSYAGFVITEAGNAPNVVGLVYISSYGPAEGESHDDLVKRFSAPPGSSAGREWLSVACAEKIPRSFRTGRGSAAGGHHGGGSEAHFEKELLWRAGIRAGMEFETFLVSCFHGRSHDQSRVATVHGEAHGRNHHFRAVEPRLAGFSPRGNRQPDRRGGQPQGLTRRRKAKAKMAQHVLCGDCLRQNRLLLRIKAGQRGDFSFRRILNRGAVLVLHG